MQIASVLVLVTLTIGCGAQTPQGSEVGEKLPQGDSADNDAIVATEADFNVDGAPTVVFSVPDMMCEESCVPAVQKILAGQPGVEEVHVALDSKTATVAVDEQSFDADAAIAALVDMQFTNTAVATNDDAELESGSSSDDL
ncbi:MAG: heavy-metal-associated domain-containing protein, partial [Planctomycetota bacterium]